MAWQKKRILQLALYSINKMDEYEALKAEIEALKVELGEDLVIGLRKLAK